MGLDTHKEKLMISDKFYGCYCKAVDQKNAWKKRHRIRHLDIWRKMEVAA